MSGGALQLYSTEAALEAAVEALVSRADGGAAFELGRELTSVPRLLEEAGAGRVELGPVAESLLLGEALAEARGPRGLAIAARVRPIVHALRRSAITPSALVAVAARLPERARSDARWLGEILGAYERRLGARIDTGAAARMALAKLSDGPIGALRDVSSVTVHAALLEPLERAVVEALLARGLSVRCVVPEPIAGATAHHDAIAHALAQALERLEAIGAAGLERARLNIDGGPRPELVTAPSPLIEAREIARRMRDRVEAGVAPDDIVIVADDASRRATIARALTRYRIPVDAPRATALDAEVVRVALNLARLAEEGVPRDRLVDLLASRYLAGLRRGERTIPPARVARAVREAVPASGVAPHYREALSAWARSHRAERREEADAIVDHVLAIVGAIASLPQMAPIARHAAALAGLLDRLGLLTRARGFRRGRPPAPGSLDATGLAHDQAGLRTVLDLLEILPRAATQAGSTDRPVERGEFLSLLVGELGATRLRLGGARGAGVRLCASHELVDRPRSCLVLAAAEEAALPSLPVEDPLLPDETRRLLARAFERQLLPLDTDREARAYVLLARARAAAAEVIVTWARADADGRALLPGSFVEEARALGGSEARISPQPVARAEDARDAGELLERLGMEAHGEPGTRQGLDEAALAALHRRLDALDAGRVARVDRLSAVERARAAYFAGLRSPGPHDGRLADPDLLAALAAGPLPGHPARPLSASTMTRYADCPHRFFLEAVLRLRPPEELGDDLDELSGGGLAHLALERVFATWQAAGLLPLTGRAEEAALIASSLEQAVDAFLADHPRGHERVFAGRVRALGRTIEALWRREVARADRLRPTHFELPFDGLTVEGDPGEAPVSIGGTIDRVDVGDDRVAVFDYKSGRLSARRAELKEEAFGDTSWQLPLYAAALRRLHGARELEVGYYSLRELEVRQVRAPAWLVLDRGEDPERPTLGDRIVALGRALRAGRFEVAPREGACDRCRMQAVCRMVERDRDEPPEDGP